MDIHMKLMKYKFVPTWWFVFILVSNISLVLFTCQYYNESLQLPWWGVLVACAIAFFFILPIGIIAATINQAPGLNIFTEYVIGYLCPELLVANMCFQVYGYIIMTQGLTFVSDFKIGHYMKIPPQSMFMPQVVGTLVAVLVCTIIAWWLMERFPIFVIPHCCHLTVHGLARWTACSSMCWSYGGSLDPVEYSEPKVNTVMSIGSFLVEQWHPS
ncbi:hypothetical protein J1N35_017050 [Gossypium stocksii]|uniref:Uncharacterized protein n=1 Tax=Gossypium stocksii TaxID=47602 RepID=A0A9D3VN92_9ROSI|nr:hypothetical protein J1N35_017050 [Gossypium stocksii]